MHLLIIILQQLLGMLPSGKSEKAPQTETVRPQGQAPRGYDRSACVGLPIPMGGWMTGYWMTGYSLMAWLTKVAPDARNAAVDVVRHAMPRPDQPLPVQSGRRIAARPLRQYAATNEQGSPPNLGGPPPGS
jgi:hypothetical protein